MATNADIARTILVSANQMDLNACLNRNLDPTSVTEAETPVCKCSTLMPAYQNRGPDIPEPWSSRLKEHKIG